MKTIINNIKNSYKEMVTLYKNNENDIIKANFIAFKTISAVIIIVFSGLFIASYFVEGYEILRYYYLTVTIMGLTLLSFLHYIKKNVVFFLYFVSAISVIYSLITSAFVVPDYICVTILATLFIFAIFTLDKSYRINIALFVFSFIYLLFVLPNKDPDLIADEFINVVAFFILSIIAGRLSRNRQLENFELKRLAIISDQTDSLTKLYNRKKCFNDLETFTKDNQEEYFVGIVMLDIDQYKLYNDTYGHLEGDQCLIKIASYFKKFEKKYSVTFYRYGGEEFVGIIYDNKIDCRKICNDLVKGVYDLQIPNKNAKIPFVTISAGLAWTIAGSGNSDYEKLLFEADEALYMAKAKGRNNYVCYSEEHIVKSEMKDI